MNLSSSCLLCPQLSKGLKVFIPSAGFVGLANVRVTQMELSEHLIHGFHLTHYRALPYIADIGSHEHMWGEWILPLCLCGD